MCYYLLIVTYCFIKSGNLKLFCCVVLCSDQTDPFNRQPLNMAMVKPATELLQRIMEWRASQSAADSNQPSIT